MSSKADQFSDEEKKHLSYLGSMLRRPVDKFDEEVQRTLDGVEEEDSEPTEQGQH